VVVRAWCVPDVLPGLKLVSAIVFQVKNRNGAIFFTSCVPIVGLFFGKRTLFFHWRVPTVGDVEKKCTSQFAHVHARKYFAAVNMTGANWFGRNSCFYPIP
jgi:hypothetical protein